MPILVTCPGCKKSFNVDEKFAGKTGPCPHCKTKITVPQKQAEVKVHAPDEFSSGGKTVSGKLALKPIAREETKFTPLRIAGIVGGVAAAIAYAVAIRMLAAEPGSTKQFVMCGAGLLLVAPFLAIAAYAVLRDTELEPFRSRELYLRAAICGAIYALLWGVFAYIRGVVFKETQIELYMWPFIVLPFFAIGGMAGKFSFDLETVNGFFHYAFYVAVTIVLGLIAGVGGAIWA
jgi:hypothetical protein